MESFFATFLHCLFENNSAYEDGIGSELGGAIHGGAVLEDCDFIRNKAGPWGGGALYGSYKATRCRFIENFTTSASGQTGFGGAVYALAGSAPFPFARFDRCLFLGNSAPIDAGAIYTVTGRLPIENCLFIGNTTGAIGGAIFDRSSPQISHCVFVNNHAALGGGFVTFGSTYTTITHSIFWGNTDDGGNSESAQIAFDPDGEPGPLSVNYSAIQGWTGALGGVGNTGHDPVFVDPIGPDGIPASGDENFRLSYESPLINAGDPDFDNDPSLSDLDGHARVLCSHVDMGAYEFGIGDVDCNGTIDLSVDYAVFHYCIEHSFEPVCIPFDFNMTQTVDLLDFAGFQNAFGQ